MTAPVLPAPAVKTPPGLDYYSVAASPAHRGGASTILFGTFCSPDSTISFGNGSELTGAIFGKQVRLGAAVNFTADSAPVQ